MKIITHNGYFHADDLLSVAALLILYPDSEVVRSRDQKVVDTADIVVDVGQIYDPDKLRFDHHQTNGAGERQNGIPYASFGLVWKEFGERLSGGIDESKVVEERIVMPIDANDNGVKLYVPKFDSISEYSLGDYFDSFVQDAQTMEEFDEVFFRILPFAGELIRREIKVAQDSVASWKEVKSIYNQSENKKIIVLPEGLHWKRVLIPTEALFAIFPRSDGMWTSRAVPREINGFELKKSFPLSWSGLNGETLRGVSGVKDAVFCHRDCHLAVTETKEGAIKLAEIALNS